MRQLCRRKLLITTTAVLLASISSSYAQEPVVTEDASTTPISSLQARNAPAFLHTGLIYEVFPRAFSPEGNLNGVTNGLDRLKALGVTIVWLMPIHPVGHVKRLGTYGSPYAAQDYYAITPDYGTKDDLRRLVQEAHRRQMKVILDIVADHTSFDSVMLTHPEFYKHDKAGQLVSPHGWNDVAALNYANPALRRYMLDMLVYWVKNFDIDGYRCDAAGEVPTDFWEQARTELDRVNPNIIMLAEASKPELMRSAFDIDYAWPLLFKLNEVIMHGAPASDVRTTIEQQQALFPKQSLHMLISDDHDEQRAIVKYGVPGALASTALMFTLDGTPLLYNGMEAGDATPSTGPALFESLKIYWQGSQLNPEFKQFYSFMVPFRQQHPALLQGKLTWVHNSDEQHVISYLRQAGEEEFLVVINLSNTPFRGTVEAGTNMWQEIKVPLPHNLHLVPVSSSLQVALPSVSLDAFGFRMFQK